MKFLLLLLLLGFACTVAMVLLTRLLKGVQQLRALRSDLARNDATLQRHLQALQEAQVLQAEQQAREAQQLEARDESAPAPNPAVDPAADNSTDSRKA